jgi:hypothetical protein
MFTFNSASEGCGNIEEIPIPHLRGHRSTLSPKKSSRTNTDTSVPNLFENSIRRTSSFETKFSIFTAITKLKESPVKPTKNPDNFLGILSPSQRRSVSPASSASSSPVGVSTSPISPFEHEFDFLQFLSSNEKVFEQFSEFLKEHHDFRYIEYYNAWTLYITELNEEKQKQLANEIYFKFMDPKNEEKLRLPTKIMKKAQKTYTYSKSKAFYFVLKNVQEVLEESYDEFLNFKEMNETQLIASSSFDDLIKITREMNLFQFYVKENNGGNLIKCFKMILKKKKIMNVTKKSELREIIIKKYVEFVPKQSVLFNSEIRDQILKLYKHEKDEWVNILYEHLFQILLNEYYTRFLNSTIWNQYVNIYSNRIVKNEKCSEFYEYLKLCQKFINDDYYLIEIHLLRHKITSQQFISKRITMKNSTKKDHFYV